MLNDSATTLSATHVGRALSTVREAAGVTQAELGRRVTLTQTALSRIESGERPASGEELSGLLAAIGTDEAIKLLEALQRTWRTLEPPALDHPDADLLWEIESAIAALRLAGGQEDVRPAFARRLAEYERELEDLAKSLMRRDHEIALIGPIGVGKSTAICWATDLQIEGDRDKPVLFTGAGGSTLCEVRLRVGSTWGIVVEPRAVSDIAIDVAAFAEALLRSQNGTTTTSGDAGQASDTEDNLPPVPSEVERAIRNMARLTRYSVKGPDGKVLKDDRGKVTRVDPAVDLASEVGDGRELALEILDKMGLHRRDRREEWLPESTPEDPRQWLRSRFRDVNNGNHPDFSMPARVDVFVPELLDVPGFDISIVDTRGIDERAARVDIDARLEDEHTVSVLCTGFNDAPGAAVKAVLGRAREIDNRMIDTHCSLLVLPRSTEPLAVKHDDGEPVESADEGCDLKEDKIRTDLQRFSMQGMPIAFFDFANDEPSRLTDFLVDRVLATRTVMRDRAADVTAQARALLENAAEEQLLAVQREASATLLAWLRRNAEPTTGGTPAHEALLSAIANAYAATVRASVRREGAWDNLDFNHELGHGARRLAVSALQVRSESFRDHCRTLADQSPEAAELLHHADRLMASSYDEALQRMQIAGSTLWKESFVGADLWSACEAEWGQGPGYKQRVLAHNRSWLTDQARVEIEGHLTARLTKAWHEICERIGKILEEV
jgi:transcriptional regulator with XRE-family HTH domain